MKKFLFLSIFLFQQLTLFALNGPYQLGYGTPSKGIGGAAVAFPQDTLSAMTNPANLVSVGKRVDLNVEYLRSTKISKIRGSEFLFNNVNGKTDLSRNKNMMSGEAGGSWTFFEDRFAVGLLIAPQLSNIIKWNKPDPYYVAGTQDVHINLMYLAITPTFALEVFNHDLFGKHTLGVGVDFTPAQMKVEGLQGLTNQAGFLAQTAHPNHVTNKGWDCAFGGAFRVGYLWQIRPWISAGVAYRSKTWMSAFNRYRGLFSPDGKGDLPATLFGGISVKPLSQTTIVFDVGRIYNRDVKMLGNSVFIPEKMNQRGRNNGASFAWNSSTVYKIGITQELLDVITLRVGYNYGQIPWREGESDVALSAQFLPMTTRHHLTCGVTLDMLGQMMSAAFIYGFKHSIRGPNETSLGGGKTEVSTDLIAFQIGISKLW